MPLSRRTAADVPHVETLYLSFLFSKPTLVHLPVTSANAQIQGTLEPKMNNKDPSSVIPAYLLKTSYDFLFKRSIQSSETEGQIFTMCGSAWTFRTALATAGARSRGHSLPSGGYHTNSSCGKKMVLSLKICTCMLYTVDLKIPLINTYVSVYLHFPWKSFKLRHFNQLSGGTSREGFA